MKKTPMRTCVMCRQTKDKRELLRIVRQDDKVKFDPTGKANGRGAYVCTSEECLNNVKNQKKVSAALSVETDKDNLEEVFEQIKQYVYNKKA